ncbi:MAG: M56 family metallopeptidase [Bacteroidaceae bacterium]|nr:M56 family metallopeptidase [Bacteroidaceae bacterium]
MTLYIIKSAITLALLYSCFFFLLSREAFHRFNRIMLLGILVCSLIVPLLHTTTAHPTAASEGFQMIGSYVAEAEAAEPQSFSIAAEPRVTWLQVVTGVYLCGVAFMLLLTLVQGVSLARIIRGGLRHTDERGNTVVLHRGGSLPPFSFFRYIVMGVEDYENHRRYILVHEQEHIRLGHSYDLLLLEVVKTLQWFNPFVWFLSRDLKAVHEYEADQAVIHQGIDAKSYQQLLVRKVVGSRLQLFVNSLNHGSLKTRIFMMYQKPKTAWRMLKALCAIPVVALAVNAFATPEGEYGYTVGWLDGYTVQRLDGYTVGRLFHRKTEEPQNHKTEEPQNRKTVQPQNRKTEEPPFAIHPVSDEYGRIVGFSHKGEPAEGLKDFVCTHEYVFINGRPATEEEVRNYQSLPVKMYELIKHPQGTAAYNYKDQHGIISFTLEEPADNTPHTAAASPEDDAVFEICEEPARYPGGDAALQQFIAQNIRYPKSAMEHGISGRVVVGFVVNKDGSLTDFKVVNNSAHDGDGVTVVAHALAAREKMEQGQEVSHSPEEIEAWSKALETEAFRVLQLSGKWEPAKQRGHVVRNRITQPINFRLR